MNGGPGGADLADQVLGGFDRPNHLRTNLPSNAVKATRCPNGH